MIYATSPTFAIIISLVLLLIPTILSAPIPPTNPTNQMIKRGLDEDSKISLAVGIGVGVPALAVSAIGAYYTRKDFLASQRRRWCGLARLFGRK